MLRNIFDGIFDSVFMVDSKGHIVEANEACCRALGYGRDALLRMDLSSILSEKDAAMVLGLRRGEKKRGLFLELRAADGSVIPVEVNAQYSTRRRRKAVLCVARERTGDMPVPGGSGKEGERYRAILEGLEDGYWETDLTGRLTFVNDAMCRMAEATREELLSGVNFSDYADSETKGRLHRVFEEVFRTGKPAAVGDYEVARRDGSTGVFQFNVSLIRDDEGQPIGFRGITRDVTVPRAMERALRESEESYRNVLELAPDAISIVRRKDSRYLQVNDAFCRQTGYSTDEIIDRTSKELDLYVDPADRRRLFDILAREGQVDGMEIRYRARDGTILDDLISARTIRFRGEECFLVVATVITSLRKAQEALRGSEEKYRTILENMEEGYYETDHAGRFTFVNDAMLRMLGFSREELMKMDYRRYTAPEAAERIFKTFSEVWRTGKPVTDVVQEVIKKDGTSAAHEMSVSLLKNERGTPVGFRGVVRDVTRRKAMEEALRESEEKYRTILENMGDGYWEIDLEGRFTFFNDALCRMVGISAEELMGLQSTEFTKPEVAERTYAFFNEVYRTGKQASIVDYEFTTPDGNTLIHEMSVSLMRDEKGTPVGFRGVSRDVTARKKAEAEIRTHREHLALINQILRHDLTNDLVVIQSALNLHKISHEKELLEETIGRVKKSLRLIGRMKELESFISAHRDLKAYQIRDVVREVAESYPFLEITVKGKAQVMADDALVSVIDNIIRNAVIHGKADRIEVTIDRSDSVCEVRIADNGSGVADEVKEKIFEEGFVRGDTGNTGLGLHIVTRAMEKYGGHIYVEDNQPRGAAFVLTFRTI